MLFLKDFLRNLFQLTPSRRATTQQEFADRLGIFQLTPSRRATSTGGGSNSFEKFQLTPSRRATFRSCICYNADRHFNSRPHGGRQFSNIACHMANVFQLTPSRRATYQRQCSCTEPEISTHALTEGDEEIIPPLKIIGISTHALTEGDCIRRSASVRLP